MLLKYDVTQEDLNRKLKQKFAIGREFGEEKTQTKKANCKLIVRWPEM